MSEVDKKSKCHVRVQRYMSNRLLSRKQFVVRVEHGRTPLSKAEIKEKLQSMFHVQDDKLVQLYGFKTPFGGGMSKGFGLIYDNLGALKKFEPRHRLIKLGLAKKKDGARKQKKERKNRIKRLRTKITKGDKKKKKKD